LKHLCTPLYLSVCNNHYHIVEYLVSNGADINSRDNCRITTLHNSAQYGYLKMTQFLVDHGADINSKDFESNTPLHYSSKYGTLSIIEYLVKCGAEIDSKDFQIVFIYFFIHLFIKPLYMDMLKLLSI